MTGMEEEFLKAAEEVTAERKLPQPIPKLCTLVVASPFDAAVHDAYGKLHGLNVYNAYGKEFMNRDLSAYLTKEFKGEYLDKYTLREPKARMPLYHLVGALDPITEADVKTRINDGLPNTLPEWIVKDGLTHLKIKLNGNDLAWDVTRVLTIDKVTEETQNKRGLKQWFYSADFNEKCPNVGYLIEFMKKIREANQACFDRIQYIEQPTSRYLKQHMDNKMHEAAKLRPVVIDEALVDFEHLRLSMELGYSGVALKTCKGQSQALLMGAAAIKYGLFLCVQDLTLVGASFLHSAGLCARVPQVAAIEGNGRQYCPAANKGWEDKWPTIFKVKDGTLGTGVLTLPGLGHYED
jgi:L-alanine-DL-glutamate epimerase-like enolase superfamily enzyme